MYGVNKIVVTLVVLFLISVSYGASLGSSTTQTNHREPVYVVIMNHVEGDTPCNEGDYACLSATVYQTHPLPLSGISATPSYSLDIVGNDLIYEILQKYTDSLGQKPKLFIEPAGEWWQTYNDPIYGGRAFDRFNHPALGNEFGIQGHAIYYSGIDFGWYQSPHTEDGIKSKFQDMHYFAGQAYHNGVKVNGGKTYTGGWKLEKDTLGDAYAEYVIDHEAYALGYRISFEDHDGHIEDEPQGINNSRPSYYVYRSVYDDGVQIIKIDMNGSVKGQCGGNTPRCETPEEAVSRLDDTIQRRIQDSDSNKVYFFGFVVHSGGVWNDFNNPPLTGEGLGFTYIMDAIQEWINNGADIRFVTPFELASIFEAKNPVTTASPFGFHPALVNKTGYATDGYFDAQNIGVGWTRPSLYAFWFKVQPDVNNPSYYWEDYDSLYGEVPEDINILANIAPQGPIDEGHCLPGSFLPIDAAKYISFVKATVERYDGDGIDDMPGLQNPIKYWQVGNEPNDKLWKDFAGLQQLTYQSIKAACSDCKVLIGGATGFPEDYIANFNQYYAPILAELGGKYVDIFDFHWYGSAEGEYKLKDTLTGEDVLDHIRSTLVDVVFQIKFPENGSDRSE